MNWEAGHKLSNYRLTQMNANSPCCIYSINEKVIYSPNGTELQSVDREIDLRITIMRNLKSSQQCSDIGKKVNSDFGLIGRELR